MGTRLPSGPAIPALLCLAAFPGALAFPPSPGAHGNPLHGHMPSSKDPAQLCFKDLDAAAQQEIYGRLVNIGASFTHGCMTCDASLGQAQASELTGDASWIRRNFLTHFFFDAPWKNPAFRPDGVFVLENDAATKPLGAFPEWQLSTRGYSGLWHHSFDADDVQLLSASEAGDLARSTPFLQEASAVGGLETRRDRQPRKSTLHGVAFFSYSSQAATRAPSAVAFDLAKDGGRMQDVFRYAGAGHLYQALEADRWADPRLRAQAASAVARRISSLKPGAVLAVDILFWDAFARTIDIVRERGTRSIVLKFIIAALERSPPGRHLFDGDRSERVRETFYDALVQASRGDAGHAAPVLLGKLMDDAARRLRAKGYEPVIAALISQFASQLTGTDISGDLVDWLRGEVAPAGERTSAEHVRAFAWAPRLSEEEKNRARTALGAIDGSSPRDPTGRVSRSNLPGPVRAISTALLFDLLRESGTLLDALSEAMAESNVHARRVAADPSNGILLLDVDEFFEDFGAFLKPQTMHPSSSGAKRMGGMLMRSLCGGKASQ